MSQRTAKFGAVDTYVLIVLAILAAALIGGCTKTKKEAPKPEPAAEATEPPAAAADAPKLRATIDQVTLRWQDGSKVRLAATANKATGDEIAGTGVLENASAALYRDGKKTTILKAPKVNANRKEATVKATGGAVLESVERKTVLRCPDIEWRANEHKIIGTGGVTLDSENGRVVAESFVADTELKTIEFRAGPSGGLAMLGGGRE